MLPPDFFAGIPGIVASSTTGYLIAFAPILYLVGGMLFAFVVFGFLISLLTGHRAELDTIDMDDTIEI